MKTKRLDLKKMSRADAQVAVADDVVAQVRAGRYVATHGTYYVGRVFQGTVEHAQDAADNARDCAVCAVGAGVVSAARVFDGVFARRLARGNCTSPFTELREIFPAAQLRLMETAFELWWHRGYDAAEWGARWSDAADRLEAVWANVAANGGEFDVGWSPSRRTRLGRAMRMRMRGGGA